MSSTRSRPDPGPRRRAVWRAAVSLVLVLTLVAAGVPVPAAPTSSTVVVCPEGPPACDAATIQDGVDLALEDGTVVVRPGTYEEAVQANVAGLTVCSTGSGGTSCASSADRVTVDARTSARATIRITARDVTLQGLTVANTEDGASDGIYGVAIEASGATVNGSMIVGNLERAQPLPGLNARQSGILIGDGARDHRIRHSTIRSWHNHAVHLLATADGPGVVGPGNTVQETGSGGIVADRNAPAIQVTGNRLETGGPPAVVLHARGGGVVQGNEIVLTRLHDGQEAGTGILVEGSDARIESNRFTGAALAAVRLATGPLGDQPDGVLRDNRFRLDGADPVALLLGPGVHDLTLDARANDWGIYDADLLRTRVLDRGTRNGVRQVPYQLADGTPEPGLIRIAGEVPVHLSLEEALDAAGSGDRLLVPASANHGRPNARDGPVGLDVADVTVCGTVGGGTHCTGEIEPGRWQLSHSRWADAPGLGSGEAVLFDDELTDTCCSTSFFPPDGTSFLDVHAVSFDYRIEAGDCGAGSPRIAHWMDLDGDGTRDAGETILAYSRSLQAGDCPTGTWLHHDFLADPADTFWRWNGTTYDDRSVLGADLPDHEIQAVNIQWDNHVSEGRQRVFIDNHRVMDSLLGERQDVACGWALGTGCRQDTARARTLLSGSGASPVVDVTASGVTLGDVTVHQPDADAPGVQVRAAHEVTLRDAVVQAPGPAVEVEGTDQARVTGGTFDGPGASIQLQADGSDQPSGFTVQGADLHGASAGLVLGGSTGNLTVAATCNDWGLHHGAAIGATRIDDAGSNNTVAFQPFVQPGAGLPRGCLDAPVADFTPDPAEVRRGETVELIDRSRAGSKPILAWDWSFGDGDTEAVVGPNGSTSHAYSDTGTYVVELGITDADGMTDETSRVVRVIDPPPAFEPVDDQEVAEGDDLTFAVQATDPEGQPVDLSAPELPAGASFTDEGDGRGTFSWTPDFSQAGDHSARFEATDGTSTVSQTVEIDVLDVSGDPKAEVLVPEGAPPKNDEIPLGEAVRLRGRAADADGTIGSVVFQPNGTASPEIVASPSTGDTWITGEITYDSAGPKVVLMTAADDEGNEVTVQRTFDVVADLSPVALVAEKVVRTDEVDPIATLDGSPSFDPEGEPMSFVWRFSTGEAIRVRGPLWKVTPVGWDPPGPGRYTANLTVLDPAGNAGRASAVVLVDDAIALRDLHVPGGNPGLRERVPLRGRVVGTDLGPVDNATVDITVQHPRTGQTTTLQTRTDEDGDFAVTVPYDLQAGGTGINLLGRHEVDVTVQAPNRFDHEADPGPLETASGSMVYHVLP